MKTTELLVTYRVKVLHDPNTDPAEICEKAELGYDDEDGAIAGAEVVEVKEEEKV